MLGLLAGAFSLCNPSNLVDLFLVTSILGLTYIQGATILRARPYVSVLGVKELTTRCSECYQAPEPAGSNSLLRCSKCKFMRYCSPGCQRNAWNEHKEECSDLLRIAPQQPTESILLLARLLRRRAKERLGQSSDATGSYRDVMQLNSHREQHSAQQLEAFFGMAALTAQFVEEKYRTNMAEIVELFCKFHCNAFNISDPEMRSVGSGLYPLAALINHSCSPNAVAVFSGKEVTIRAIAPIPAGAEVTLTYIEVAASTADRQRDLRSSWFFDCGCELCCGTTTAAKERETAMFERRAPCPHGSPGQECGHCADALSQASVLRDQGQKEQQLKKLEDALALYRSVYVDTSLPVLHAAQPLLTAAIDQQSWPAAERACALTVAAFQRLYKPNWPLTGLQLLMLGKLEKLLFHLQPAALHLKLAYPILCITHGSDHPIVRTLLEMRDEVDAELAQLQAARNRVAAPPRLSLGAP